MTSLVHGITIDPDPKIADAAIIVSGPEQSIVQLYLGYLNRAADPEGLAYWIGRANAGMTLLEIAQSFAVQPEYQSLYGGLGNAELVDSVYGNLFNREADIDGRAYWIAVI